MRPGLAAALLGGAALAGVAAVVGGATAQTVDVERPRTLVVGTPTGPGARADRVDVARTGSTATLLPAGGLRAEWRFATGAQLEVTPLVDSRGTTYVVGTRGEVVAIARDGSERWRASTGAMQPGPAALLSDDTLVFVDVTGDAVALRAADGSVRYKTRFGRSGATRAAPLPLDDGGVVVATSRELAALDLEGHERARTTLPEPASGPLVAALGRVAVVTAGGVVWTWVPGAAEVTRVASFGSAVEDGAALVDERTLVAVSAGRTHLTAVDLVRGTSTTRAVAPAGLWLGPPATRDGRTFALLLAPTGTLALGIDATGAETMRALLAMHPPPVALDGGPAALEARPHAAPLVDAAGTLAFATPEGAVGVVARGVVDVLPDACAPSTSPGRAPAVTLAPLGPGGGGGGGGAMIAACRSGTVLALRGAAR